MRFSPFDGRERVNQSQMFRLGRMYSAHSLLIHSFTWGFGGAFVRARTFHLATWVQFPLGKTYDSYVKRVSQRSAESRGFSPDTPVSSHREC